MFTVSNYRAQAVKARNDAGTSRAMSAEDRFRHLRIAEHYDALADLAEARPLKRLSPSPSSLGMPQTF